MKTHTTDAPAATDTTPAGVDSSRGWQVVAATFLSTFTVFGVSYSFGAFFRPMADEFGAERSETAFFFAITVFLYFLLGVGTGRIADRIGPRPVLLVGTAAMAIGLLLTSRVQALWAGYLTYGIGVGIGVACAYVPMVATVGAWFEQKRTTALGVAVAGIGVGTLVVAPTAERLIERYGWRDTYVMFGIASVVLLGLSALGAHRPPVTSGGDAMPVLRKLASSRDFWLLYLSTLALSTSLFVPFVFMDDYMDSRGISGSPGLVVGVIGLASVVGRLGMGALAAHTSVFGLYRASELVLGLSFGIWLLAGNTYLMLILFATVLGVAYGGFIALSPAVAAQIFGPVGLGGVLGLIYTAAGVGGLIGPPLMGAIIDQAGYATTLWSCFGCGVAAFAILLPLGTRREQ